MKSKENLLILGIISNVFFTVQFLLTNAMTGAIQGILMIARGIVFYMFKKRNIKPNFTVLLTFIIAIVAATMLTWQNALSAFPLGSMLANIYGQWQNNMKTLRILAIVGSVCWFAYEFYYGMYTSIIMEICIIVSSLIAIWRFRKDCESQ